jgi:hypothetical protein
MARKRIWLFVIAAAVSVLLAGCANAPVKSVYTASGDGTKPADLTKTDVFLPDDDLNVVITLNAHNHELVIYAVFTAPTGETYPTDDLEADMTVGEVVLGLDWEAMAGQMWPEGDWSVAVFVDEEQRETAGFRVESGTASG